MSAVAFQRSQAKRVFSLAGVYILFIGIANAQISTQGNGGLLVINKSGEYIVADERLLHDVDANLEKNQRRNIEVAGKYEVLPTDISVSFAIRRWAVNDGYQLVWDVKKDFPARPTKYQYPNIEDALEELMKDLELTSYPLHACVYKNRVIRVLHVSDSCER